MSKCNKRSWVELRVKFLVEIEQHYYDLRTVTCNKSNKVRFPCLFFFTCVFYFMIFDLFRSMYTILVYNVQMYSKYNLSRLCTALTTVFVMFSFHPVCSLACNIAISNYSTFCTDFKFAIGW